MVKLSQGHMDAVALSLHHGVLIEDKDKEHNITTRLNHLQDGRATGTLHQLWCEDDRYNLYMKHIKQGHLSIHYSLFSLDMFMSG